MRFLVVDSGDRQAWRIGEALRELGQEPIISPNPTHAVELARKLAVDAVIADLGMPSMNGVELAEALWLFECYVPMAFRQTVPRGELVSLAAEIGLLFPVAWTRADMERIVRAVAARRPRQLARGSETSLPPAAAGDGLLGSAPAQARAERDAWVLVPVRKLVRKLHVTCRTWAQLEELCARHEAGRGHLTLRGTHQLAPGDHLTVVIELPSAVALSMAAAVRSVRSDGGAPAYVIELVGLNHETCALLRASARTARATPRREAAAADREHPEDPLADLPRPGSGAAHASARDHRAR